MSSSTTEEWGAETGAAEAMHWCPHVNEHIKRMPENACNPNSTVCSQCPNTEQNWLCLTCYQVHCGRFAQRHAAAHYEATGHAVVAGVADLSFWCYACEVYLFHRTIPKIYTTYVLLNLLKFGEPPIDPPLASADPDEQQPLNEQKQNRSAPHPSTQPSSLEDDDGDSVMETSAMMQDTPVRTDSSSQLERYDSTGSGGVASPLQSRTSSDVHSTVASTAAVTASSSSPSVVSSSSNPSIPQSKPTHLLCPIAGLSTAQLSHPLIQQICGIIYGNALGDAFGLATEFMDRKQVNKLYGETYDPVTGAGAIPFPNYLRFRHNSRWTSGDWTDDTDQMILILETFLESYTGKDRLNVDPSILKTKLFASKLSNWVENGFPDLGDTGGLGLGALTHSVISKTTFLESPQATAEKVWSSGGKKAAANGGLMRTSITGVVDYYCQDSVLKNTLNMCRVTHADPRCTASCVLTTTLISTILRGADISSEADTEKLIRSCLLYTEQQIDLSEHKAVFEQHVDMKELEEMKMDDGPAIGYTLKCLAAGLYGLRRSRTEGFIPTMTRLVREAGDADTNGAVCGALIGARLGYDGLPAAWLAAMPNKKWLDKKVVAIIALMMDRYEAYKKVSATSAPSASSSSSSSAGSSQK